jgi:hypothetical protein
MALIRFFITLVVLVSFPCISDSQQFFRIKTDYSVKYNDSKGNSVLQMGVVYYDLNSKIVLMRNGFPIREFIVQKDTSIYHIRNNYIHSVDKAYAVTELSIFHLALTGEMEDYGLKKAGYKLDTVKSEKGLILTTWSPPDKLKEYAGKIMISVKDKKLFGIVFLDKKEKIIAKHFFRNYTNINGFVFPTEVLRITYEDNLETSMLTTYSKIIINDTKDEEYYNYTIPEK